MSTAAPGTRPLSTRPAAVRSTFRHTGRERPGPIEIRTATSAEADAIHVLVLDHLAEGHLLPRERDEIGLHAHRFVVAMLGGDVVACAELAPLSKWVAEVRSLVVGRPARGTGVGGELIAELLRRATLAGFEKLCAFTQTPSFFVPYGFSIVPHVWLPEKIVTDCSTCRHFRRCGRYPLVRSLGATRRLDVPLASLRG